MNGCYEKKFYGSKEPEQNGLEKVTITLSSFTGVPHPDRTRTPLKLWRTAMEFSAMMKRQKKELSTIISWTSLRLISLQIARIGIESWISFLKKSQASSMNPCLPFIPRTKLKLQPSNSIPQKPHGGMASRPFSFKSSRRLLKIRSQKKNLTS